MEDRLHRIKFYRVKRSTALSDTFSVSQNLFCGSGMNWVSFWIILKLFSAGIPRGALQIFAGKGIMSLLYFKKSSSRRSFSS